MTPEFTQTFFLSAGETNAEREMSLPLLTSKIIDIATAHANALGVGNPAMESLHCGWVLSRIAIEMERYPRVNETYRLTTWVEDWNKHFSMRCFMVCDGEGNPLGYARSVWMVLSTETRESMGLEHLSLPADMISKRECPIARSGKHRAILPYGFEGEIPRNALVSTSPAEEYTFRYCDLDYYRHVNTVRYVSMLLNQFTLEEMDSTQVKRMEMSFMHESRYGETVEIRRHDDALSTAFSLNSKEDSNPHLYCQITRVPRLKP